MTLTWTLWLGAIVLSFAILETVAIRRGRVTLSQYVYRLSRVWPLIMFVSGLVIGGAAVHFFWPYCPSGGPS